MLTITQEDNMQLMDRYPDGYFDLAIVDPPYRNANQPTKQMRKYTDNRMSDFGNKPNESFFKELFRVSKHQIIWGGNNFIEHLKNTNNFIFWFKHQPFPNYSDGEMAWTSFDMPAKCFNYPFYGAKGMEPNRIHPTQKPVALYKWILDKYAKPGDKILDTHLGSGSIAIACHDAGFDLTACELDPDYFSAAMKRIDEHRSQLRIFDHSVTL